MTTPVHKKPPARQRRSEGTARSEKQKKRAEAKAEITPNWDNLHWHVERGGVTIH